MAFTFAAVDKALDIVNNAMLELGHFFLEGSDIDDAATITDSDNTHVAVYKNFHKAIKTVLRESAYTVVSKKAQLSAASGVTDIEYAVVYSLPSDYVRLNGLILNGVRYRTLDIVPVPFRRKGNQLMTDFNASIYVDYNYYPLISDTEANWDAYFDLIDSDAALREAIEIYLAYKLCYPIKKDSRLRQDLYDLYLERKAIAQTLSDEDSHQKFTPPGPIIEERFRTR